MIEHTIRLVSTGQRDRVIVTMATRFCLDLDDSEVVYDGPLLAGCDVLEAVVCQVVAAVVASEVRIYGRPVEVEGGLG